MVSTTLKIIVSVLLATALMAVMLNDGTVRKPGTTPRKVRWEVSGGVVGESSSSSMVSAQVLELLSCNSTKLVDAPRLFPLFRLLFHFAFRARIFVRVCSPEVEPLEVVMHFLKAVDLSLPTVPLAP